MREIEVRGEGLAKDRKERKWCENRLLIDSMLANGLINHSRTEENWKRNWNVYTYRATNEFQLEIYLFHKMEKWVIDWNRTGYNIEIWITHITHIHTHRVCSEFEKIATFWNPALLSNNTHLPTHSYSLIRAS